MISLHEKVVAVGVIEVFWLVVGEEQKGRVLPPLRGAEGGIRTPMGIKPTAP